MNRVYSIFTKNQNIYSDREALIEQIEKLIPPHHKGFFKKSKNVLIKPNWVFHPNETNRQCLITNENLILAFIEYLSSLNITDITIADAPIQGCDFNLLNSKHFHSVINEKENINIKIIDLRSTVLKKPANGKEYINNRENYVEINLGESSYLEEITHNDSFRVTMYDHRDLRKKHSKGNHRYLIYKDIFNADVIVSMPKLKTHKKAGITGALKNIVGINGKKEYLPHHRIGSSYDGGDCYDKKSFIKAYREKILDKRNMNYGKKKYILFNYLNILLCALSRNSQLDGSWHGNDTVWRMVLDLNKIIYFFNLNEDFSNIMRKNIFHLTDAIVVGEGNGPLDPKPKWLGMLSFGSTPSHLDHFHASILGFNPQKIPLITNSYKLFRNEQSYEVFVNEESLHAHEVIDKYGITVKPPDYWNDIVI